MRPVYTPQIRLYQNWLARERGLAFDCYDALWRWSIADLPAFWQSIWDYFDLKSPTPHSAVLREPLGANGIPSMVTAQWFAGAQVNYAQQVFRHVDAAHAAGMPALISHNEKSLGNGPARKIGWPALRQQVASLALHLRAQGVQPGDRVAAYLPNIPEAMVAFLATVSIGGVWSICAPDMGTAAVLDRFRQIEPKVLIACDGVRYGGHDMDRLAVVAELCAALPSVKHLILHENLDRASNATIFISNYASYTLATARINSETVAFEPVWLPFDHPLWIVYSSGTTGLPKPIVHGHGGTVLVALMGQGLHNDLGASYSQNNFGERFHWYSSTGWVMWNAQTNGLLFGATCCIFDGNPAGSTADAAGNKVAPDWGTLYRFAGEVGVTFFGAGAAFFANCMKADIDLSTIPGLETVRALGTTGSPLSADVQSWGNDQFAKIGQKNNDHGGDIWWANISGGTDFAGAFIAGNRELPQVPGEMQCRVLGCAVEAWSEQGEPVVNEVGELVCTRPIPSMPLYFWGDAGNQRYLSSYFDMYPGKNGQGAPWRHGDWLKINDHGGCIIYGRSDATINRHGLRMGTSELYSAVEALPEVLDSLVVDLEYLGRDSYMPLFVVLREGVAFDDVIRSKLNNAIKTALSPRFVPSDIFQVPEIPRTLSGKKQELPIKKLLLGQPIEKVINKEAMANPVCLDWYVKFAHQRNLTP
jgi:acetoacetyl-CoA synthetase